MTILSGNLKTIRKDLNCTQMALSKVLEIEFRTYVRYEAGERDAPVSALVKLARLGNVSLDRLLTTKVFPEDLQTPDQEKFPTSKAPLEVIGGGLEEGRLMFKDQLNDNLISTNKEEQKLLTPVPKNEFRQPRTVSARCRMGFHQHSQIGSLPQT